MSDPRDPDAQLHEQMEAELEQTLIAQEQRLEAGSGAIPEQADGLEHAFTGDGTDRDGQETVTAGAGLDSSGAPVESIGDPGRGTDADEPPMQDQSQRDRDEHDTDNASGDAGGAPSMSDRNDYATFEEDAVQKLL